MAAHLCEWVKSLHLMGKGYVTVPKWREVCKEQYAGIGPLEERDFRDAMDQVVRRLPTCEDMLQYVAEYTACNGDLENAARKILQDFRSGCWGLAALQIAPLTEEGDGELYVHIQNMCQQTTQQSQKPTSLKNANERTVEQQQQAVQTAQDLGLELPPSMQQPNNAAKESEVGKGLFDGW